MKAGVVKGSVKVAPTTPTPLPKMQILIVILVQVCEAMNSKLATLYLSCLHVSSHALSRYIRACLLNLSRARFTSYQSSI